MSQPKKKPGGIVRPFGLIGGRYQVDAAGLLRYRLAWAVAIALGVFGVTRGFGLPPQLCVSVLAVGLVTTLALCIDIVRKGERL